MAGDKLPADWRRRVLYRG